MEDTTLEDLVNRARGGDANAFGELVRTFEADVLRWIRRRLDPALRSKFDEMDILQSAVREAFEGIERLEYQGGAALRNWLIVHASRKIASIRATYASRKRRLAREVGQDVSAENGSGCGSQLRDCSPGPVTRASTSERDRIVRESVEQLDEPYRTVMRLELNGQNAVDIALTLKRPSATVRAQRIEARRRLIGELRRRLAGDSQTE